MLKLKIRSRKPSRFFLLACSATLATGAIVAYTGSVHAAEHAASPGKVFWSRPAGDATTGAAAVKPRHHWYQLGRASWYGQQFQGRETASGDTYDMYQFTCAHRSLPLGTWLKVTNMHNHKWVVVRVNDRGPVPQDRVVDLSYAAAQVLHFGGLAPVKLEVIDPRNLPQVAELRTPTFPRGTR